MRDGAVYAEGADADWVVAAREAERRDIARGLHDTVVQPLSALVMSFECLADSHLDSELFESYVQTWKELAHEAMDSLRHTLEGLSAHPHAELGLPEALRRHLAPQMRSYGIEVHIEGSGWPADLPLDWTTDLYFMVREALTNVEKHAHASEVGVLLRADARRLYITVVDNGMGCPPRVLRTARPGRRGSGLGIPSMRERVRLLGGELSIIGAPGRGTRLEACIPRPSEVDGLSVVAPAEKCGVETAGYLH